MLQFWRHKHKELEINLRKIKYQIDILSKVIKSIGRDIECEDNPLKITILTEKKRKLLSNKAWFSAILEIEITQRQVKLKEENLAYCVYCDIIKEYDASFCAVPERDCNKNLTGLNLSSKIDKYKETI